MIMVMMMKFYLILIPSSRGQESLNFGDTSFPELHEVSEWRAAIGHCRNIRFAGP